MTMGLAILILRRLAGLVVTMIATSIIVYGSLYLAPGDPVSFLSGGKALSPEAAAAIREQYHLGHSFFVQYWYWATNAIHGDFGLSIQFRQPVGPLIESRLGPTAFLVAYAVLLVVGGGILVGVASAVGGRWVDAILTALSTAAAAVPPFVAALALIYALAIWLPVLPSSGTGHGFFDRLEHMTLPAIALAMSFLAIVARVTRSAMRTEMQREHVEMARSRGVPFHRIVTRHALWNSLPPVMTISALVIASLLASTTVIEQAFGQAGIGSLLVNAVQTKDFAVVQAVILMFVAFYVVLSNVVDILYGVVNPRMRGGDQ
jgi:peptide/nickel transport system permease protein